MFTNILSRKCIAVVFFGIVMCFGALFVLPQFAAAQTMTEEEMQAEIDRLTKLVAELYSASDDISVSSTVCPYVWTRTLTRGDSGQDVKKLQQFLNEDPDTLVAESGFGSPGNETSFYGRITADAVSRFQNKYRAAVLSPQGLVNPNGEFDSTTKAKVNSLCGDDESEGPYYSQDLGVEVVDTYEKGDEHYIEFEIEFDVTAANDDLYIPTGSEYIQPFGKGNGKLGFIVLDGDYEPRYDLEDNVAAALDATADRDGDVFVIDKGDTETFTLAVAVTDTMPDEKFMVRIGSFTYSENVTIDDGDDVTVFIGSSKIETGFAAKAGEDTSELPISESPDQGLAIEVVGTNATVRSEDGSDDYGKYRIDMDVTAFGDDVYIYTGTTFGKDGVLPVEILDQEGNAADGLLTFSINSTADKDNNFFRIDEGETETVTVFATFEPEKSGKYSMRIQKMPYVVGSAGGSVSHTSIVGGKTNRVLLNVVSVVPENSPELHVVGVYEAQGAQHSFCESEPGDVVVNISPSLASTSIVLGLSAYEPVRWMLNNPADVEIEKILITGYNPQMTKGTAGISKAWRTYYKWSKYEEGGSDELGAFYDKNKSGINRHIYHHAGQCKDSAAIDPENRRYFLGLSNYAVGYDNETNDELLSKMKKWSGIDEITTFQGDYSGDEFTIGGEVLGASFSDYAQVANILSAIEDSLWTIYNGLE